MLAWSPKSKHAWGIKPLTHTALSLINLCFDVVAGVVADVLGAEGDDVVGGEGCCAADVGDDEGYRVDGFSAAEAGLVEEQKEEASESTRLEYATPTSRANCSILEQFS